MKLILSINVYLSAYESNLRIEEKILCCILTGILASSHITGCTISSSIGYEQAHKSEKEESKHIRVKRRKKIIEILFPYIIGNWRLQL